MKLTVRTVAGVLLLGCVGGFALPALGQQDIVGLYRFLEDEPADISAAEGAEVLLSVEELGKMYLSASMPGDVLTTEGRYQLKGNLISLDFPELGKSVEDGPWSLRDDILILPLQFIGDGEGTSKWEVVPAGDGPVVRFFQVVNREGESGTPPEEAVRRAAEEAKRLSAETEEEDAEENVEIEDYEVWDEGEGCTFEFENGHKEIMLVATAAAEKVEAPPQRVGPLAVDPRTHISAKPHTAPDDPENKSAVIFAPFHNAPYWATEHRFWAFQQVLRGKMASWKELGENLELIERKLRSCHYDVTMLVDHDATPRRLHHHITTNKPAPGVIYVSTHGGASRDRIYLTTGVYLGPGQSEAAIHDFLGSETVASILHVNVPPGYLEDTAYRVHEAVAPMWFQQFRNIPVCFLGISDTFFAKMVQNEGVDFSTSFMYANGCSTGKHNALAESSGAKMVLGHVRPTHIPSNCIHSHYLFMRMAKPTFSVREVLGLMKHVVHNRVSVFYPEDAWLAGVREVDNDALILYGADAQECEIPTFDSLYLCWMARWDSKDPEEGCEALQQTYDNYWSKGSFSRLKSPFANAGVRGTHMPTAEEVELGRHLVCGVPAMGCGRFTLNDTDPSRSKPEANE